MSSSGQKTTTPYKVINLGAENIQEALQEGLEWLSLEQFSDVGPLMESEQANALLISADQLNEKNRLILCEPLLNSLPGGLALVDGSEKILWHNTSLAELLQTEQELVGGQFYEMTTGEYVFEDAGCPFATASQTQQRSTADLKYKESLYYRLTVIPVTHQQQEHTELYVVVVQDRTEEISQRNKLNAIYHAGLDLGDLSLDELFEMSVDERIEMLKMKILHYTKDLLALDTIEIRKIEEHSAELTPLLAYGMDTDAENRQLYCEPEGNGVTGFVASTGQSYLCKDTTRDPLYLVGAQEAKSSLTVPLILHEQTIGTLNVESPSSNAFDNTDLQFLELFGKEIAQALNTLDLLAAEKETSASQSAASLLTDVSEPVNEILNDAVCILERYIGHEPNVAERLNRILRRAREIRGQIHQASATSGQRRGNLSGLDQSDQPKLANKRILVVDCDESVRRAAHELLSHYGCEVETAHNGEEAFTMVKNFPYNLVIADIRLTDMTGFDCFNQLREIRDNLPVILMTGFGYDPSHSIVKARQMGLKSVLYKPFRRDQLLKEITAAIGETPPSED